MEKKREGVIEFCITTHLLTKKPMVEVWQDGKFIASIYTHEDGVRIVSKYLNGVEQEVATPPSIVIKFSK